MESFLRDSVDLRGDAHFFDDATSPEKIVGYLGSSKESEKLKGMKWLLAMLSKGRDVAEFFPDVVKNVVVKSVEVKKMVYIYLVHYADFNSSCREIALLSINSFQKDMAGTNQLIRGLALRVMTSIRVPDIIQIQLLAVRKCATDSSPYVRRCAATALTKIFAFDESQIGQLKLILEKLLLDTSTMVLGSAIAAFNEICPHSYDILHRGYRKLCHLLADMDEWTQVSVLEVMTRYVRNQFTDPAPGASAAVKLRAKRRSTSAVRGRNTVRRRVVKKAFYSDEEDESDEEEVLVADAAVEDSKAELGSVFGGGLIETEGDLDPDHRLIMRSSLPLLKSRNSGVVLAVCALHYYCGVATNTVSTQIGKALVRILRNPREMQYVVLSAISTMAQERPAMFRPFLQDFFVKGTDPVFNRLLKLEILTCIATKENMQEILRELQTYARHGNKSFVCATVRAVGRVVDAQPEIADNCMEGILHLLQCNKSPDVTVEAVIVLRQLLQQTGTSDCGSRILRRLVKMLIMEGGLDEPAARASVVWLVGEYHDVVKDVAPDVLRLLAAGFPDEEAETRMQILNLAIKQSLRLPDSEPVQALMTYVLEMARYDTDTDIRDRARFLTAITGLAPSGEGDQSNVDEDALEELSEHAQGVMLAPKLPPLTLLGPVDVEGLPNFTVGSLSSLVGHQAAGYQPIPSWPKVAPDLSVRDAHRYNDDDDGAGGAVSGGGAERSIGKKYSDSSSDSDSEVAKKKVPKGFYADESSEEEESEEESEGSEEASEDESEEDDDTEESDSEAEDESEEESVEASEEESSEESEESEDENEAYASRIPLNKAKPAAASNTGRMGIRKVTGSSQSKAAIATSASAESKASSGSLLGDIVDYSGQIGTINLLGDDLLTPAPALSQSQSHASSSHLLSSPPFGTNPVPPVPVGTLGPGQGLGLGQDDVMSRMMESFNASAISSPSQQPPHLAVGTYAAVPPGGMGMQGFPSPPNPLGRGSSQSQLGSDFLGMQYEPSRQRSTSGGYSSYPEVFSDVKHVLRPEVGGGLQIDLVFRHGAKPALLPGANCVVFSIRNTSEQPIRRIRMTFPSDLKRTPTEDIPVLAPREEVRLPSEIILIGVRSSVRVEVRSDKGTYHGTIALDPWAPIVPSAVTLAEAKSSRAALGGFNEVSTTLSLPPGFAASREDLIARTRRMVNLFPAQGEGDGGEEEILFTGVVRKSVQGMGEEKLILTLRRSGVALRVQVNGDDALIVNSLIDALKKGFLSGF